VHARFRGDLGQPAGPVRPQADLGRLIRPRAEEHGPGVDVEDVAHLEVRGRGDYLPDYAGNLDIITAAAARVGELLAAAPAVAR